jgi:hypothetical protein
MKKIAVLVDGQLCAWVDTVVRNDEYEYTCAVLVNAKSGIVFLREISTIKVIDTDIID